MFFHQPRMRKYTYFWWNRLKKTCDDIQVHALELSTWLLAPLLDIINECMCVGCLK